MCMGSFGVFEIALILIIVVIIFGVGKLPDLGSGLGKSIMNFKKAFREEDEKLAAGDEKKSLKEDTES